MPANLSTSHGCRERESASQPLYFLVRATQALPANLTKRELLSSDRANEPHHQAVVSAQFASQPLALVPRSDPDAKFKCLVLCYLKLLPANLSIEVERLPPIWTALWLCARGSRSENCKCLYVSAVYEHFCQPTSRYFCQPTSLLADLRPSFGEVGWQSHPRRDENCRLKRGVREASGMDDWVDFQRRSVCNDRSPETNVMLHPDAYMQRRLATNVQCLCGDYLRSALQWAK